MASLTQITTQVTDSTPGQEQPLHSIDQSELLRTCQTSTSNLGRASGCYSSKNSQLGELAAAEEAGVESAARISAFAAASGDSAVCKAMSPHFRAHLAASNVMRCCRCFVCLVHTSAPVCGCILPSHHSCKNSHYGSNSCKNSSGYKRDRCSIFL